MKNLQIKNLNISDKIILLYQENSFTDKKSINTKDTEEKLKLLIIRDLTRLWWRVEFENTTKISITPPKEYSKSDVIKGMSFKREELILKNKDWIDANIDSVRANLANWNEVLGSEIIPVIEICETKEQLKLFKLLRFYWSSSYSDYVWRRIKVIVRDYWLPSKPVIWIAALGSPIIHIPDRDNWIWWDRDTRTKRLNYTMDAYIIWALPPYNELLWWKLMASILASNEIRQIYKEKYKDKLTIINWKTNSDLACIFTTSLYGRSSQYNRLKYLDKLLYNNIWETKGFWTLHLSEETFATMTDFLKERWINLSNSFWAGPSWKMRVIHLVALKLGFNADFLLNHSFKRWIYAVPLARNFKEFLLWNEQKLDYYNFPIENIIKYWKERWLFQRLQNVEVISRIKKFRVWDFKIY